jgi:hypothetical protein
MIYSILNLAADFRRLKRFTKSKQIFMNNPGHQALKTNSIEKASDLKEKSSGP